MEKIKANKHARADYNNIILCMSTRRRSVKFAPRPKNIIIIITSRPGGIIHIIRIGTYTIHR